MTWLPLGKVGKAHGLKGAFFVSGRELALPSSLQSIAIGATPEHATNFKIFKSQMQSGRPLLMCEGINHREALTPLVGQTIWGRRAELGLSPDEHIWADLMNKEVLDSQGVLLGRIVRVNNYGASDVIYVRDPNRGECAIPFVDIYFDLNLACEAPTIQMLVPAETFDESWE